MAKRGKLLILVLIIVAAVVIVFTNGNNNGPPYAPSSTSEMGISLFYDTLRQLDYPVRVGYAPLTRDSNTEHAYILVQPTNPMITTELAEEMLEWVRRGGRLVFLFNSGPTAVDRLLAGTRPQQINGFNYYRVGLGSVVTGQSYRITNLRLISDAEPAVQLHGILSRWDAERIVFSAYYHGMHPTETLFSRLPLVIRLVIIQLGIAVLLLLWHLGKRFGKPVPAYEETEREEHEHVRALARLYIKTERKNKNAENING
jgi:hypothetical protein